MKTSNVQNNCKTTPFTRRLLMLRLFMMGLALLLPGFSSGQPFDDLELALYPLWAEPTEGSISEWSRDPHAVYALYEHHDLATVAVTLTNYSNREITLEKEQLAWNDQLVFSVSRSDSADQNLVSWVPRERFVESTIYYLADQRLTQIEYSWNGRHYLPSSTHDATEVLRTEVASFPEKIGPYDRLVTHYDLVTLDGSPLPQGEYQLRADFDLSGFDLRFRPYGLRALTAGPIWLKVFTPQTTSERIESDLIRASYLYRNGEIDLALDLLEQAHDQWPDSLKVLDMIGYFSWKAGRVAQAVQALEALRLLALDADLVEAQSTTSHSFDLEGIDVTLDRWRRELTSEPPAARVKVSCDDLTCVFDARESEDDFGIFTYRWQFGDGSPIDESTSPISEHTYAEEGDYSVTLTVIDGALSESSVQDTAHVLNVVEWILHVMQQD